MRPSNDSPGSVASTTMDRQPKSPWHSPVPYLFGGLAAMLGLIAFALLILACSYWRLSGRMGNGDEERDLESGEKEGSHDAAEQPKVYEEKILVIMAGQEKPTFLATPVSSKASSFNDKNGELEKNEGSEEKVESAGKVKSEEASDQRQHEQIPIIADEEETETHQQQTQEH